MAVTRINQNQTQKSLNNYNLILFSPLSSAFSSMASLLDLILYYLFSERRLFMLWDCSRNREWIDSGSFLKLHIINTFTAYILVRSRSTGGAKIPYKPKDCNKLVLQTCVDPKIAENLEAERAQTGETMSELLASVLEAYVQMKNEGVEA